MTDLDGSSTDASNATGSRSADVPKLADAIASRSLLESLPGAWFLLRSDGSLHFANSEACRVLGYDYRELVALRWWDIAEFSGVSSYSEFWVSVSADAPNVFTGRHIRKGHAAFPTEIRASRIQTDGEALLAICSIDQTEREAERVALRTATTQLDRVLNQVPDLVFRLVLDPAPRFDFVTPKALGILGYSAEELCGPARMFEQVVHSDDRASLLARHEGQAKCASVIRFLHRDGHFIWTEAYTSQSSTGDLVTIDGVARDVSRELEHEQALEDSVELLRSIIDHAPVIVWSLDRTGRFELSEGKGLNEVGLQPGQVVGQSVWDLYAEFPSVLESTRRALAGNSVDGTWDFGRIQFDYHYAPHFDSNGQPAGATGVAVDVSRRYRAEKSNQQLLTAIEQAAEAVVVTDPDGRVVYVNPAYVRTSLYSKETVVGQTWRDFEIAQDPEFLEGLNSLLVTGHCWSGRIRSRRSNGTKFDEEATLSPIRGESGELAGCVAVKRDITHQIRWEEQLRQSQKMEAVGQLAGGIAHDFNNLLQIIRGNLELLSEEALGEHSEHLVADISHASSRAARLVGQLLAFSRKDPVDFVFLHLDRVIFGMLEMLRRLLGEDIQVEWHAAPKVPHIRANAPQLEQIVINLCVNARDAMPRGGRLRLSVGAEPQSVRRPALGDKNRETTGSTAEYAVLTVEDEGEGMHDEVRQRIFEPFFTTKGVGKGTGLGLATVYAIVERHGGFIDVSSELGKGTVFRLFFPTIEPIDAPSDTFKIPKVMQGKDRLVLVAEDDPQVRNLTARFLTRVGFRVLTATDGLEAETLIRARESELSVVILDAIMPHLRGPDVYLRLRDRGCMLPCLIVTGYDFQSLDPIPQLKHALVLQKPFDGPKLFDRLARLLGE